MFAHIGADTAKNEATLLMPYPPRPLGGCNAFLSLVKCSARRVHLLVSVFLELALELCSQVSIVSVAIPALSYQFMELEDVLSISSKGNGVKTNPVGLPAGRDSATLAHRRRTPSCAQASGFENGWIGDRSWILLRVTHFVGHFSEAVAQPRGSRLSGHTFHRKKELDESYGPLEYFFIF